MEEKYTLTWDKDSLADGYIVTHQVGEEFVELVRVENINYTTIILPDMKKWVEYHYRVSFYHKKDNDYFVYKNEDYYCFVTSKGLDVYKYPTPKLVKAERIGFSVRIEWEKVSDGLTYIIARKVLNGNWIRIGMTQENNYVDSKIDIAKKYIYTVRCVSDDGKKNLSSRSYRGIQA